MQSIAAEVKTYTIDPNHSTIRFWVRHLMIAKVHGEITDITGTVKYNEGDPSLSEIDVTIGANSLTTHQEQRDGHLKSPDFLDVAVYPNLTYKSTRIAKTGDNAFDVTGNLTLHGVTREVTIKAETTPEMNSPFGGLKRGVNATGTVSREDFGITWNQALEAGGVMVGKEVHFEIDLELDRPE